MSIVEKEESHECSQLRTLLTPRLRNLLSSSDLHRFLLARKFDITAAVAMIQDWDNWYNHPLSGQPCSPRDILNDIEDPMEDIHTRLCPISHMGEDKAGHPIYWEKSGLISGHFSELIEILNVDDMLARHVRNSVSLTFILTKMNSPIRKSRLVGWHI
jgi:hypothetical protein